MTVYIIKYTKKGNESSIFRYVAITTADRLADDIARIAKGYHIVSVEIL